MMSTAHAVIIISIISVLLVIRLVKERFVLQGDVIH